MAKYIYKNVRVYHDYFALGGKLNSYSLEYDVDEKDAAVLTDNTFVKFPGLFNWRASGKGFIELGAGDTEFMQFDQIGGEDVPHAVVKSSATPAEGDRCFFGKAFYMKGSPMQGSVGDMHEFDFEVAPSYGVLVRGQVALPETARTAASGNSTGFQIAGGVPTGYKLYAGLFVTAATVTDLDFTVESDVDDTFATPTTVISLSNITAAGSAFGEAAAPITDTYFRATWARTGGSTFTAALVIGVGLA